MLAANFLVLGALLFSIGVFGVLARRNAVMVLMGLLTWAAIDFTGDDKLPDRGPTPTTAISDNVLSNYLVPFLALSFVLHAAAIGAIVLARKD